MQALTQTAAGWLLNMPTRTLRDLSGLPRNDDKTYNARHLVDWLKRGANGPADDDPLLSGPIGTSPALERYRQHRADLAEIELNERRGRLVDVDELTEWWESEVAGPLRRAVGALKRKHGPDAARIVEKALTQADAATRKRGAA